MDRIKKIIENEKFIDYLKRNENSEIDREFCKHDFQHLLDTARIAEIINLEKNLNLNKEIVYAAALLHDIGKWMQYSEGVSHEKASASLSYDILKECYFNEEEIFLITEAIEGHRKKEEKPTNLKGLIGLADKMSRNCFYCISKDKCNWSNEKKNKSINF